jgi:hypothetical protein
MCARHWRMVPKHIQREIWATYRPGQEIDKRPSAEYMAAQRRAIDAVKDIEGFVNQEDLEQSVGL